MTSPTKTPAPGQAHVAGQGQIEDRRDVQTLIAVAVLLALVMAVPAFLWWRSSRSSAAFADSEVLESNHLGAATLDLEIGDDTATLRAENMAPGDVVSGQLQLVNAGTLPLQFTMTGTTDGDPLSQWLRFDVWRSDTTCRADAPGVLLASNITLSPTPTALVENVVDPLKSARTKLPVDASTNICVGAVLLLDAPNALQGRRTVIDLVVNAVHDLEADQ